MTSHDDRTQRRISVDGPHKSGSEMWCTETDCDWQAHSGTAEAARDHVTDTGHTVVHDYVIRTVFREATP